MDYTGGGYKNPQELQGLTKAGKELAFANFRAARQFNKNRDNGQLSRRGMVWVGQGEQLRPRAAKAWKALQAAAKSEGISLGVTDAYRTLKEQKQLANEIGLYGPGNRQGAAVPGTSKHGAGRAVDVSYGPKSQNSLDSYNDAQAKWLSKNASKYGFSQSVPGEPWHIEFNPKQFNKESIKGINLKVTDSGKVKAVVGKGFTPSTFVAPTWSPNGKTKNKPTSITDAKDSGTYEGSSGATPVKPPSGNMEGAAASLSTGKVL